MRINFYMSRCIWGLAAIVIYCFAVIYPAKADICFLPTGICEQGSRIKTTDNKSCDDYVTSGSGYFREPQTAMSCSVANIAGCTLYSCTVMTCGARGYTISNDDYRRTRMTSSWSCESCQEASQTWWKCSPALCSYGVTKAAANCAEGYEWAKVENYGKSGDVDCGECIQTNCPSGTTLTLPAGCHTCEVEKVLDSSRTCYRCHAMPSVYITQAEKDASYDDSCFKFEEKVAADSLKCYKPEEIECGKDQYKSRETISGRQMCKCRDYVYNFDVSAAERNVVLPATGGTRVISVISEQIGNGVVVWDYAAPTQVGLLTIEKRDNGTKLAITGPVNKSQTTDLNYSFDIVQTQEDEATSHVITINVTIQHDTCPSNAPQFSSACSTSGWRSKNEDTSVTGEPCYKCYNDNCLSGYTRGAKPNDGFNYYEDTTDYGTPCHQAKPDNCNSGYQKTKYKGEGSYYTHTTPFGNTCYMAKNDDCGAGWSRGQAPTNGNYYTKNTDFGTPCYQAKSDVCPGSQQKSCPCGGSAGSRTDFGSQCYNCSPCCQAGNGYFGSACCSDADCISTSELPLYCFNQNSYGQGTCHECASNSDCNVTSRFDSKYADAAKRSFAGSPVCSVGSYPHIDHDPGTYCSDTYCFIKCETKSDVQDRYDAKYLGCVNGECCGN